MKRRNFLQALGFTVAAKPSPTIMNTLDLNMMGIAADTGGVHVASTGVGHLKRALAKLALGDKRAEELRKRRFYMHQLDVNVASLRSVALQHKLNMSRDALYERRKRESRSYLEARLAGILDEDD